MNAWRLKRTKKTIQANGWKPNENKNKTKYITVKTIKREARLSLLEATTGMFDPFCVAENAFE